MSGRVEQPRSILPNNLAIDRPVNQAGSADDIAERYGTRLWMIPGIVITDTSKPAGTWAVSVSSQANGRKYMLAMQCSKPAATNAEIGKMRPTILSVTERPAYASQIPQTKEHVAQDAFEEQRHHVRAEEAAIGGFRKGLASGRQRMSQPVLQDS